MNYTVKQLSKLAGVSVRTLHYYDEIGLLRPARANGNGYRHYDQAAVLRLQQILFYKELGLSLEEIADLLGRPGFDVLGALEAHRGALRQRMGRLQQLVLTVERTIAHLKGEEEMADNDLFVGFSDEQQAEYEAQASEMWGEQVAESARKWKSYSAEKKAQVMAEGQQVYTELVALLDRKPDSPEVQALIGRWHQHMRYFYEPTVDILMGLGQAYVEHPEFAAFFAKMDPRLAVFMREAIEVYCVGMLEGEKR